MPSAPKNHHLPTMTQLVTSTPKEEKKIKNNNNKQDLSADEKETTEGGCSRERPTGVHACTSPGRFFPTL